MKAPYDPDADADADADEQDGGTVAPIRCPTCGQMFLEVAAVRSHHKKVHDVSLMDVPPAEWLTYVHRHRFQIRNPSGVSARQRIRAERHPAYRKADPADE